MDSSLFSIIKKPLFITFIALGSPAAFSAVPGGTLDPNSIPKFIDNLVIPPAMPVTSTHNEFDYYEIAVRQFDQQILPVGLPKTTVWSYGAIDFPNSFNYPAFTIEARQNRPVRVKWINELVDEEGNYLPHLLSGSVDQTLHWANPPKDCAHGSPRTDCEGQTDKPYEGPVPIVTHLHGAHVGPGSDGYPESWWLPDANNIPSGYATRGGKFDQIAEAEDERGAATFQYPNDQPATTLWFHDHSLGMTRQNVYAGPAGFYHLRDDIEDGFELPQPYPEMFDGTISTASFYEIPIVIQDRSFNADGSLFYPTDRAFFEGLAADQLRIPFEGDSLSRLVSDVAQEFDIGRFTGKLGGFSGFFTGIGNPDFISDIAPIWNPETFFNTVVVNGKTWPKLDVEQRRYRFRVLNGANSRAFNLKLIVVDSPDEELVGQEVPFFQIGSDGGLLHNVVMITTGHKTALTGDGEQPTDETPVMKFPEEALLLMPAERADVIIDFTDLPMGTKVRMLNDAPDAPFGGFPDESADPATTGQVMQFELSVPFNTSIKNSMAPESLPLSKKVVIPILNPGLAGLRQVTLNEEESLNLCVEVNVSEDGSDNDGDDDGSVEGEWALDKNGNVSHWLPCAFTTSESLVPFAPKEALLGTAAEGPLTWMAPMTELPGINAIETWEIINNTEDAHPIHQHLIQFQVVDREDLLTGEVRPPEANETGWKDTVIVYPGEIARVTAQYDHGGLFVWHCHILEHEDNEMMRPFCVTDNPDDTLQDCNGVR